VEISRENPDLYKIKQTFRPLYPKT